MKQLSFLTVLLCASAAFAADVVKVRVEATDGFGGDLGSVESRCQTAVGKEYDPTIVTRDINALKATGEFEEITADAQRLSAGVEVTYRVKRKLRFLAPLVVKGCDYFSESRVAKEAALQDGKPCGEGDLAAAAAKVRLAYQKKYYLDAKIKVSVERIPGGNNCTVTFTVDEGRRQKIHDYVFAGCASIDEDLLHEAINDLPWWNPMGWFSDSPVTDDQLAQCVAKLEDVYRDQGYLDARVTQPVRVPYSEEKIDIRFQVSEGPKYVVGDQSITGLTKYPEGVVKTKSALPEKGAVAGKKVLDEAAHRIKVVVGSGASGLADTAVEVRRIPREDMPNMVDIVYAVKEGVPVVIDEILIRGNDYTKDKVIRREIRLGPGDPMLEDRAERSQKRLENLNYFSRVRYYLEASDRGKNEKGEEYRNLVYEVEEKNTGSFMVGVGASSVDSVYVSAEVSQSNFDIFAPRKWFRGAGQKGRAYVQWGPRISTIEASVTEPYFLNRQLEFTVEGYRRGRWYDQYDLYRSGGALTLSYPVKFWPTWRPFGRLGARYTFEFVQFDDVDSGTWWLNGRTVSLQDEESKYGDAWESVVRFFWSRDGRDNFRLPTKGGKSQIFFDISAGGDNQFWRAGLNHRHYFPVWKRFNHVFMGGLRLETIDKLTDEVPIYDRMFLGGPRTIRGVRYRHVSPLATHRRNGDGDVLPWGGKTLFCMNFEYTIPIVKMLRFAVFSDLGSVGEDAFDFDFGDTFTWSAGVGIRLDIPMFPIRLDFAKPFVKADHAEEEIFSFLVGYDF